MTGSPKDLCAGAGLRWLEGDPREAHALAAQALEACRKAKGGDSARAAIPDLESSMAGDPSKGFSERTMLDALFRARIICGQAA